MATASELLELLKKAAYLTLYSMPNPKEPSKAVFSVDPLGVIAVRVDEQLHRFPIDLGAGSSVGEPIARVQMQWTPAPEAFHPVVNVEPPPTLLDPNVSQRFVTLNGAMTYLDRARSEIHAFGHGHTFPMFASDSSQLHMGAAVDVLKTFGSFSGLAGTVVVNGHIKPPTGLSLAIVVRFMDPEGKLSAKTLGPVQLAPNPDPGYTTLLVLGQPSANASGKAVVNPENGLTEWHIQEDLRLLNVDLQAGARVFSKSAEGPVVGTHTGVFRMDKSAAGPGLPISETGAIFSFFDLKKKGIGDLRADIYDGDAFPAALPGAPNVYRFGAFGPVRENAATAAFEGTIGMMTVNGAFSLDPLTASTLYIFRLYDPYGSIRSLLRDAWVLNRVWSATPLDANDQAMIENVESSLQQGLELYKWWEQKDADESFAERIELVRTFNRAERAYGFFDEARLQGVSLEMMGLFQQTLFDRPKIAGVSTPDQLREYVLRYFLRTTDFREPVGATKVAFNSVAPALRAFGFDKGIDPALQGFGYSQQYYKLVTGEYGKFSIEDQYAIVDLRDLGKIFDWIVMKINLFNFKVAFQPFGESGPQLTLPLSEETWVVLSRDFVIDRNNEYGVGYALLKTPVAPGLQGYGPGHFEAGFQTFHFEVDDAGVTRLGLTFAANRPEKIMNIPYDPVALGFQAANALTLGLAGQLAAPLFSLMPAFLTPLGFDPLQAYIAFANAITAGGAAEHFGISKSQLEQEFLVQHFMQHYQMLAGALVTYRDIPDWLAAGSLPKWIRTGVLSEE